MAEQKCFVCGTDTRGMPVLMNGWWEGHGEIGCLLAQLSAANAIIALLKDNERAVKVAKDCHDPYHDPRSCLTCSSREDGIEEYRTDMLGEKVKT